MNLWHLNTINIITLSSADYVPLSCIDVFHIVHIRANLKKKPDSQNFEKHEQTSINLANGVSVVNFEHIPCFIQLLLLLNSNK